nr:uncharacterized protein LOC105317984 [Crassostrea gigas]
MDLSKSQISLTVEHHLNCGTEDYEKNCQFHCNDCHQPMCEQCRDEHQRSPITKNHEVAINQKLPVQKCKIHSSTDTDLFCEECQIPLCTKCAATQGHCNHLLIDLEKIYTEKILLCQKKIAKIQNYLQPSSQGLQREIAEDITEIKQRMNSIRTSIEAEAKSIKEVVDAVTLDKIEQVNKIEESLLETLNSQKETMDDYTHDLNGVIKTLYGYIKSSSSSLEKLISLDTSNNLTIQPIPETTKPVLPVFTAGQYSKEEVTKLLGRVTVPDTKPVNREIKPMEIASTQLKSKEWKEDEEKSDMSSAVTKVMDYTVPEVDSIHNVSLGKSGTVWGSDYHGNLVKTDLQGNQLQKIQTSGGYGYHTVTQDGDLIYTDRKNKVINRITVDNTITEFIKTGNWEPISIHSSHINGDILVGMIKNREAKVTRYSKTGKELERDFKGQGLYGDPHYITENINGDICTSDLDKRAVVVVNKSGQHRFSYTGQGSEFCPYGICTDILGHILVCDIRSDTVYLLDQDGQFLSLLLTAQQGVKCPRGLCVDDKNNLHVGQWNTNTVTVYKYLQ